MAKNIPISRTLPHPKSITPHKHPFVLMLFITHHQHIYKHLSPQTCSQIMQTQVQDYYCIDVYLWLCLPVDKSHGVDGVESHDDLGTVELGPLFRYVVIAHEVNKVTTSHIIHHHVQVTCVLECKVQLQMVSHQSISYELVDPLTDWSTKKCVSVGSLKYESSMSP